MLEAFHIVFSWNQADTLFAVAKPDCVKNFSAPAKNEIRMLFDMIRTERDPNKSLLTEVRLAHLPAWVREQVFISEHKSENTDSFAQIVNYAKDYIAANFAQNITIRCRSKLGKWNLMPYLHGYRFVNYWSALCIFTSMLILLYFYIFLQKKRTTKAFDM